MNQEPEKYDVAFVATHPEALNEPKNEGYFMPKEQFEGIFKPNQRNFVRDGGTPLSFMSLAPVKLRVTKIQLSTDCIGIIGSTCELWKIFDHDESIESAKELIEKLNEFVLAKEKHTFISDLINELENG